METIVSLGEVGGGKTPSVESGRSMLQVSRVRFGSIRLARQVVQ